MVTIEVWGQSTTFMMDTGAEYPVVTRPVGPLINGTATIVEAMAD